MMSVSVSPLISCASSSMGSFWWLCEPQRLAAALLISFLLCNFSTGISSVKIIKEFYLQAQEITEISVCQACFISTSCLSFFSHLHTHMYAHTEIDILKAESFLNSADWITYYCWRLLFELPSVLGS